MFLSERVVVSCAGMISVEFPTLLCMQNKLIIHSRYCIPKRTEYIHG